MKRRTANILIGVGGVLVVCLIAVVGLGVWLFRSAVNTEATSEAAAACTFDEVRERLGTTGPVLELRGREMILLRHPPDAGPARQIQTVHVLAWSPDEGKLTRVALPMWLLRMSDDPIRLSDDSRIPGISTSTGLSIRPEDIERYGPTLVIDHNEETGERVLVWTD